MICLSRLPQSDFLNAVLSDALKEMVRFQDSVLFKAFESSDTTLNDATGEIVRTNSGAQFRFEDVCKSIVFTREGKDDVTKVSFVLKATLLSDL